MDKSVQTIAQQIKLMVFDVDGVLTDGKLFYDNEGEEYKAFNSRDGHGIRMLLDGGLDIALITGRKSRLVLHRAANLNIAEEKVYQGYRDKRPAFDDLLKNTDYSRDEIAFVGDDVIDLPIMTQVALPVAVGDAHWFVKDQARYVCEAKGGKGAAREIIELILDAQEKLKPMLQSYLDY